MKDATPIIFFDGECTLCTGVVQFILKRDKKNTFRFASLQGKAGRNLFLAEDQKDSFVLSIDEKKYVKSTAVLKMFRQLGNGWQLLYPLILIPRCIRDSVYTIIAKNRYKWFGKRDSCWIPNPKWSSKFLD